MQNAHDIPERETVSGKVGRVLFPRAGQTDDSGYKIFVVESSAGDFIVKGTAPDVTEGMSVACEGDWEIHQTHGRQLKASVVREVLPADLAGIRDYLVKLKIGVGKKLAKTFVEHFGREVFDMLDHEPHRLMEVGIKGKTEAKIVAGWRDKRATHTIMIFLQGHGVAPAMSHRVYKAMGGDGMTAQGVIERLTENPYLISNIRGIGFKTADTMAIGLGTPADSPTRAAAAMAHVLRQASVDGNTMVMWDKAVAKTHELILRPQPEIDRLVRSEMFGSLHLQAVDEDGVEYVALTSLRRAEQRIAGELARLASLSSPLVASDSRHLIGPFLIDDGTHLLDDSQAAAVRMACTNPITIITGRPGTGKTATVRKIVDIAIELGYTVKCCAPTARAAVRLSESTGIEATTIHRLLGIGQHKKTAEKIDAHLVIVDETSMVGTFLMADFLGALEPGTTIIFLGDVDQLPSVDAGNVLGDLIESGTYPVARLTVIHRQTRGIGKSSGIVDGAHAVIEGRIPIFNETDFRFLEQNNELKAAEAWIPHIVQKMHEQGTALDQIQILAPVREKGLLSVSNLNRILQERFNPPSSTKLELVFRGTIFRNGDRVMQTKNDYDLGIVNGDVGYVVRLDAQDGEMDVMFSGERLITFEKSDLDSLILNYASTIHKVQGSEFQKLVIALHDSHYTMLNQNLLYTAITRAKDQCVIVGSKRALAMACRTKSNSIRLTGLKRLLAAPLELLAA